MNLLIHCPHCQHDVGVPANVQVACPRCGQPVIAEKLKEPSLLQQLFPGTPIWQVYLLMILLPIAICLFWVNEKPQPERRFTHYETPRTSAIAPSAWDGSVSSAKRFVQQSVRDPSSVKYNAWKNFEAGTRHITTADITATNGFGGPVRQTWVFSFDKQTGDLMTVLVGGKTVFEAAK